MVGAVTLMVTVQLPLAGIVPPVRRTLPSLISSVVSPSIASFSLSVPPQVLLVVSGVATRICAGEVGNRSVNAAAVSADARGLVNVIVSVLVPPDAIGSGAKLFVITGAASTGAEVTLIASI